MSPVCLELQLFLNFMWRLDSSGGQLEVETRLFDWVSTSIKVHIVAVCVGFVLGCEYVQFSTTRPLLCGIIVKEFKVDHHSNWLIRCLMKPTNTSFSYLKEVSLSSFMRNCWKSSCISARPSLLHFFAQENLCMKTTVPQLMEKSNCAQHDCHFWFWMRMILLVMQGRRNLPFNKTSVNPTRTVIPQNCQHFVWDRDWSEIYIPSTVKLIFAIWNLRIL